MTLLFPRLLIGAYKPFCWFQIPPVIPRLCQDADSLFDGLMTAFGVPAQTSTLLSLKGDSAVTHEPSPFNQAPRGANSIDVIWAKQNIPCQCSGSCLLKMHMCKCHEAWSDVSLSRFLFMFLTVRVDKALANTKIRLSVQVQSLSYQQL